MAESCQKNGGATPDGSPAPSAVGKSTFFSQAPLHGHEKEFLTELTYHNFTRMRIMVATVPVILLCLLIWDAVQFSSGKWDESAGYRIITWLHLVLIVFLGGVFAVIRKRKPEAPAEITRFHKTVTGIAVPFTMACLSLISMGDVMAYGTTVAYLGAVFAYAAIFLMPHRYGSVLFGLNMVLMICSLFLAKPYSGQPIDVQLINVLTFTAVAFILSRILFLYSRKDFTNRLLIQTQSIEINRQNEEKEALIGELRRALDEVKTLSGFLPICAACKKIRDDAGYWNQLESYLQKHSNARFSHGYCPECAERLLSELTEDLTRWQKTDKP